VEQPFRLFIGGEWVEPADGHYDVVNPATEEVVGRAPEASREQAHAACAAARAALPAWSRTKPEERAEILHRAADVIGKHADDYAPLAQAETGATSATVKALQVNVAVARFRRYAKGALEPAEIPLPPTVTESTPLARGGLLGALVVRQPVGGARGGGTASGRLQRRVRRAPRCRRGERRLARRRHDQLHRQHRRRTRDRSGRRCPDEARSDGARGQGRGHRVRGR
jgi:hypothetical protein